ncbi:hypothetical protein RCG24_06845 [Neobacillus sp. OS1-32]|uniref:hypothetical protein n=1 Tax=Neobacillus sp. OS1-32 TaxID=3070682 RepID=UPI0027E003FE|nr:hypothetical protein [Neobacillus sp. OS1-32]WML32556.1 hypothetical protein RCG24_06845 [Neobacillus sp. OS1-32]
MLNKINIRKQKKPSPGSMGKGFFFRLEVSITDFYQSFRAYPLPAMGFGITP